MGMLYDKSVLNRLSFGNLEDDIELIREADWVVEVVLEDLDVKRALFKKIIPYLKPTGHPLIEHLGYPHQGHERGHARRGEGALPHNALL